MPSFDDASIDGVSKHTTLDDSIKHQLDISDSSSVSSDVSESMKFQGSHFKHGDDELDTSSDESAFIPDMPSSSNQNRGIGRQQTDTLLSNLVSRLPAISQLRRGLLTHISSASTTQPKAQQASQGSTDEEFEIINESDLN